MIKRACLIDNLDHFIIITFTNTNSWIMWRTYKKGFYWLKAGYKWTNSWQKSNPPIHNRSVRLPSKVVFLSRLYVVAHGYRITAILLHNHALALMYQTNVCSSNYNGLYDCSVRYKHFIVNPYVMQLWPIHESMADKFRAIITTGC